MKHDLASYNEGQGARVSFCKVCEAEGSELTTDCPGKPSTMEHRNKVASGTLDYINGNWVNR